jgi:hypothetical protein
MIRIISVVVFMVAKIITVSTGRRCGEKVVRGSLSLGQDKAIHEIHEARERSAAGI